jgi:hypothetical protein
MDPARPDFEHQASSPQNPSHQAPPNRYREENSRKRLPRCARLRQAEQTSASPASTTVSDSWTSDIKQDSSTYTLYDDSIEGIYHSSGQNTDENVATNQPPPTDSTANSPKTSSARDELISHNPLPTDQTRLEIQASSSSYTSSFSSIANFSNAGAIVSDFDRFGGFTLDKSIYDKLTPVEQIPEFQEIPELPRLARYQYDVPWYDERPSTQTWHIHSRAASTASVPSESWTRSSVETSLSDYSQSYLQDFLIFFGNKLIQESEAKTWMTHLLAHDSTKRIEEWSSALLDNYTQNMTSTFSALKPSNAIPNKYSVLLHSTIALVSCYRANIATYFCKNSIAGAIPLSSDLGILNRQSSLIDWIESLRDSKSYQGSSVRIASPVYKKTKWIDQNGTVQEEDVSNDFDLIKDTLVSSGAFQQLASKLRRDFCCDDRRELGAISQILTRAGIWPHSFRSQICRVSFWIHWNISEFMHSQYNKPVPVATVVALTGSALNAQATTCGEYIRTNWPTIGPAFLDIIDESLASKHHETIRANSGLFWCNIMSW